MPRRRSSAAHSAASLAGHSVVLSAGRPPRRAVAGAVVLICGLALVAAAGLGLAFHLRPGSVAEPASAGVAQGRACPGSGRRIDWKAVGSAVGTGLRTEEGQVRTAEFPRSDLHVVNAGVTVRPGMELAAEVMFHDLGHGRALTIGEFTLTTGEVGRVADRLQHGGITVSALHKHLQGESPRLWWLHYTACGDPLAIAHTVRAALALTHTPVPPSGGKSPPVDLDTAALDRAIGAKGTAGHGVYRFEVPTVGEVVDTRLNVIIPARMDVSTLLLFQPLGGRRAAINGDFVLTADRTGAVIRALRSRGISIVELHGHLLDERPRLFFLHFWATGDAVRLARDLRAALDLLR